MASFKNSAGWKLKPPKLNQRHSPSSHFTRDEPIKDKIQSNPDIAKAIIMIGLEYF